MKKKIFTLTTLAILCFGSFVFAQNANSSTTMQNDNMSNGNMSNGNMSGKRRRGRRHKKHRRGRRPTMATPTNRNG